MSSWGQGASGIMALYTGRMPGRKAHYFCLGPSLQYLHRKRQLRCEAQEKNGQIFPPSGNLKAGPDPKGQSPVAGEKVTEGSKDPGKGLGLQRALP